jgi:hypothetical protein
MDIIKYKIFEKAKITEEKSAALFTDIQKSSELWRDYPDKMIEALEEHHKTMDKIVSKHEGFIVKTIGDSFFCNFKTLSDAIKAAIEIQEDAKKNPIKIGSKTIKMRIGICYGEMINKNMKIQNKILKDMYGNCVNTSSRLESKVSDVDGFAFAYIGKIDDEQEIKDSIKDLKVETIKYSDEEIKVRERSSRLLTDEQIKYKSIKPLGGIANFTAYKCKLD